MIKSSDSFIQLRSCKDCSNWRQFFFVHQNKTVHACGDSAGFNILKTKQNLKFPGRANCHRFRQK